MLVKENGVANAIQAIYRDLEYAKTLVRQRSNASAAPGADPGDADELNHALDDLAAIEETWTFIGDESTELDFARRVRNRDKDHLDRISEVASRSPRRESDASHEAEPPFQEDSDDEPLPPPPHDDGEKKKLELRPKNKAGGAE